MAYDRSICKMAAANYLSTVQKIVAFLSVFKNLTNHPGYIGTCLGTKRIEQYILWHFLTASNAELKKIG
jgi:hypothetical protein